MKLAITLPISLASLAFAAPNPGTPTTPNIPSRELLPRFNTTDCCACFFLLRGSQFGGPRHCNDDCVCDWCGTNVKSAPYGTPCAGAGGIGNWTFCRNNCVLPTTSTTPSTPLPTSTTSSSTISLSISQIVGGDTITTRTPTDDGGGTTRTPTSDGGGITRTLSRDDGGTTRTPTDDGGGITRTPTDDGGTRTATSNVSGITRTPSSDGGGMTRSTDLPHLTLRRL